MYIGDKWDESTWVHKAFGMLFPRRRWELQADRIVESIVASKESMKQAAEEEFDVSDMRVSKPAKSMGWLQPYLLWGIEPEEVWW